MAQVQIDEARIRETAYLFWLNEGQPDGRDQEHWLKAIDALTPAKPKAKRTRKAPVKASAAKAKAAPKATAANTAKKPRATKTAKAKAN